MVDLPWVLLAGTMTTGITAVILGKGLLGKDGHLEFILYFKVTWSHLLWDHGNNPFSFWLLFPPLMGL